MKELIREAIVRTCQELFNLEPVIELTRPDEQFGDFATNVAMQLSSTLKKNSREIAQQIVEKLNEDKIVSVAGVAGPGFINVTLHDNVLISSLSEQPSTSLSGLKILVEYSDPNPFKPLHAGHLYTTLVGDVIARLVENAGAETIRLNYGGDVGLHVGKSMWAIIKYLGGEDVDAVTAVPKAELASWLGDRYVEGNNAYEDEEQAKQEIKLTNKKVYELHAQNDRESSFAHIYWYLRDESYVFFEQLYRDLQVKPFDRFIPESEVTALGFKTVQEQLKKGVFENSDGAVIFDGEKLGMHTRVFINSEGLPTYETKDVGLSLTKWQDYSFDQSIIITANEQLQYMQVVIAAIRQFAHEPAERTRHITHGLLKLSGGVKMSSRKGNILSAFDILDAARAAGQQSGQAVSEEVMLAAVKYALVKNRIGGDIVYDPEESIATEGNSGPYLQYAHARARSILAKSNKPIVDQIGKVDLDKFERTLVRKLTEYPEIVDLATQELAPHHICTYLYELAQEFNRFYEQSKVIGDPREETRLALVTAYAHTLKDGLQLLGISASEKM